MMRSGRLIRISLVSVFFAASLLAMLPVTAQTDPNATPAPVPLDTLEVSDTVEYALLAGPLNTAAFLSPDGERFLHVSPDGLCLYQTLGERIACYTLADPNAYNPGSFQWSPDGHFIAFVNGREDFADTDLMILDTVTGIVTNLTDDGTDVSPLRPAQAGVPGNTDIAPRFSGDSSQIYFLRYEPVGDTVQIGLYSIPVSGGEPVLLQILSPDVAETGYIHLWDIAPDSSTIVYAAQPSEGNHELRLMDMATGEVSVLYAVDMESEMGIQLLDFSPRGDAVLWHDARLSAYGMMTTTNPPIAAHITTLEGMTFDAVTDSGAMIAGWSPDGTALVYLVRDFQDTTRGGIYVAYPGEAGRQVYSVDDPLMTLTAPNITYQLDWSANNALLVTYGGQERLLALSFTSN